MPKKKKRKDQTKTRLIRQIKDLQTDKQLLSEKIAEIDKQLLCLLPIVRKNKPSSKLFVRKEEK